MKCKDIPDQPILEFLDRLERTKGSGWGVIFLGVPNSVQHAMPKEVQGREKLVRAKMRSLMARGLVDGSALSDTRGDFELTDKGRALIKQGKENA